MSYRLSKKLRVQVYLVAAREQPYGHAVPAMERTLLLR